MSENKTIKEILLRSAEVKTKMASDDNLIAAVTKASDALIKCIRQNGTIYSCGNGGSSNDAMHLSEELVARFKRERRGIKAMHFMDAAVLTCWSNDYDFSSVYERQAETFCSPNDVLIAISTSGNSANIIKATKAAKAKKALVIGLTGKDGGELAKIADIPIIIPAPETERIQEAHITLIHILCELIETNKELGLTA